MAEVAGFGGNLGLLAGVEEEVCGDEDNFPVESAGSDAVGSSTTTCCNDDPSSSSAAGACDENDERVVSKSTAEPRGDNENIDERQPQQSDVDMEESAGGEVDADICRLGGKNHRYQEFKGRSVFQFRGRVGVDA